MSSFIQLKDVEKRFGNIIAISDINLGIDKGEYLAILGPSGSGKTTIVKCLSGIFKPTKGEVIVREEDITDKNIEFRNIAYVFQNVALFPHLNVHRNITYSPWVQGKEEEVIHEKGEEILQLVNLLELKGFFPDELSGGISQKVGLARALATGYDIIILDEPLSALDARVSLDLRYQLRDLIKELGLTAIHITHDQAEALSVADRICIIKKGKIVECGTPEDLYYRPRNLFSAFFVGENNLLEGFILDEEDGTLAIFLRQGWLIHVRSKEEFIKGDSVVLTARPETLDLSHEEQDNAIPGKIMKKHFNGPYTRYNIELETGDLINVDSTLKVESSDNKLVNVIFDRDYTLVYHRPEEGVHDEIKLE
ncbi:MAG: ABC transporter ATP-binding protein [Candidatus Hodarchaeales archaeon]|jgi:ABC-type Fe3+/spermidine/putrescine transport system ATPase subunit